MPRVSYGFFCEIVRVEGGGKISTLGMWGAKCIFHGPPPAGLPFLGFHAYIEDREQQGFPLHLRITLPGQQPPIVDEEMAVPGETGRSGHNVAANVSNVLIREPGVVRAEIRMGTEPPQEWSCEMEIEFRAPPTLHA